MTDPEDAPDRVTDVPEEEYYEPEEISRRNAAKVLMGSAAVAATGGFAVDMVAGLSSVGTGGGGQRETLYVEGTRLVTKKGNPLKISEALPPGKGKEMTVFPERKGGGAIQTKRASTLLLRFKEAAYEKPTNVKETLKGYVAYSKVCTHEGCLVQNRDGNLLHCPCHGSEYNPVKGATVASGPAPRALPQLPLGVGKKSKEIILATGPFDGPIGPQ